MSIDHQDSVAKLLVLFSCSYPSFISQYAGYSSLSATGCFPYHSSVTRFPSYHVRLWSSIWSHEHSCRILPSLLYPHRHSPVSKSRCSNCFFLWSIVTWFQDSQSSLVPNSSGASSGSYCNSFILSSKVTFTPIDMIPVFIRNISIWVQWVGVKSLLAVILMYMSHGIIPYGLILSNSVHWGFSPMSNSMAYMSQSNFGSWPIYLALS